MKSVIGALGSDEFIRIRLGVGPERPIGDLAAYVLCPMGRDIEEMAAEMVVEAAEAVELVLSEGTGRAMARYNRRATPPEDAEN